MKMKMFKLAAVIAAFAVVVGCGGTPSSTGGSSGVNTGGSSRAAKSTGGDELDHAIREISDYLNKRIPKGTKVVFLNVKSDWPDLSEFILSGLMENGVNDEVFSVVDRQQIDAIRSELNFQWSGEVNAFATPGGWWTYLRNWRKYREAEAAGLTPPIQAPLAVLLTPPSPPTVMRIRYQILFLPDISS